MIEKRRGRTIRACGIIAALALVPVLPWALFGYAGHSFEFHVASWMELRNAWQAGQIAPTWAEKAHYSLGDPHFLFYPPVSNAVGGLLSLLLSVRLVPAAFVWAALALGGLTMYFASKRFLAEEDRLPAAAMYLLSPYMIATALVRFAAAELLVQAWLPLICLWFYQAIWKKEQRAILLLAVFLGLSWLTNIPASVVLFYGLLCTAGICAWDQRSIGPILRLILAESFAIALSAFYLLPVWIEKKWINTWVLTAAFSRKSLLFMSPGTGQSLVEFAGWAFACAYAVLVGACLWKRTGSLRENPATRTWVYLALVSFFFQLPAAILLWEHLPQLRLAQYPFRFMPLMGVALPLILLVEGKRVLRKTAYSLIAMMTLLLMGAGVYQEHTKNLHLPPLTARVSTWNHEGYHGEPEYVPPGVTPLPIGAPPPEGAGLVPDIVANEEPGSGCKVLSQKKEYASRDFTTDSHGECKVRLPVFFFPYWRAFDESNQPLSTGRDADGLLLVTVPPGKHNVRLFFRQASMARSSSAAISLVTALVLAVALARSRHARSAVIKRSALEIAS